jgi:hypothetical protein
LFAPSFSFPYLNVYPLFSPTRLSPFPTNDLLYDIKTALWHSFDDKSDDVRCSAFDSAAIVLTLVLRLASVFLPPLSIILSVQLEQRYVCDAVCVDDTLIVHLDDPNALIGEAICILLTIFEGDSPQLFKGTVEEVWIISSR